MRELNLKLSGQAVNILESGNVNHKDILEEIAGELDALTDSDWQVEGKDLIEYCTDPETLEIDAIYWSVESITENPSGSFKIMIDC